MAPDEEGWVLLTAPRSELRGAKWTSFLSYAGGIAFIALAHHLLFMFIGLVGLTIAAAATADRRQPLTEVLVRGDTLLLDGTHVSASQLTGIAVHGLNLELHFQGLAPVQLKPTCAVTQALDLLQSARRLALPADTIGGPYRR